MSRPLALILYEKLMPGSQLVNRLQDVGYRSQALADPDDLPAVAKSEKPLIIFADLDNTGRVLVAITDLRQNPDTAHIPVVAFVDEVDDEIVSAARTAGVTVTVTDAGVLSHLPQLLEQALRVE